MFKQLFEKKRYLPNIKFTIGKGTFVEAIIGYGVNNENGFYVLTDNKKLIFINDEDTQNMIHYGDQDDLVDISDCELDRETGFDNKKVIEFENLIKKREV